MRVLFTTWAWPSHLYAMVPLAWACRAAGHEVLVASQPELAPVTAGTGLPGANVGSDVDAVEMVRGYLLPTGTDRVNGQAPRLGKGPRAVAMFLAHAESMVDDLITLARDWAADLIVSEPTAWAGPIAAAAIGVPAVRHLYGTDLMNRAVDVVKDALRPLAQAHGVSDVDPRGALTIDPTPPGFQLPGTDYPKVGMRYVPFNGPGRLPGWLRTRPTRQRVCVTWGHTMAKVAPPRFIVRDVLDVLAKLDVEVVAAVSSEQLEILGDVPAGVRVAESVPLNLLTPSCDLVVAHGGAGTVLTALTSGVPMLLIPQLPDHVGHAGRVLATGAGAVLTRDEATPAEISTEATRLLHGTEEREAAAQLARRNAAQPPPAEIVAHLELLAGRSRGSADAP
jgi:UDP:flavonoid glycosyltransferase YjiC (YdhE family)